VDKPQKESMELLKKWNYGPDNITDVEKMMESNNIDLYNLKIIRTQQKIC